jgi:hypothetical protein
MLRLDGWTDGGMDDKCVHSLASFAALSGRVFRSTLPSFTTHRLRVSAVMGGLDDDDE